VNIGRRVTTLR